MTLPTFEIQPQRYTVNTCKKNMVLFVEEGTKLSTPAKLINEELGGSLLKTLKTSRMTGKAKSTALVSPTSDKVENILAMGVGKLRSMKRADWVHIGITLGHKLDSVALKDVAVLLGDDTGKTTPAEAAEALLEGLFMGLYRYDDFLSEPKPACTLSKLSLFVSGSAAKTLTERLPHIQALGEGQALARYTVDSPPNVANPEFMAQEALKLKDLGLKVKVIKEDELKKMGMNLMMAVGQGANTADQPRLVIMEYNGAKKGDPTHAIVGKGVMFDTGGYIVKPGKAMQGMKGDMGGAAAVLGAMRALAERKPNINVVGVMGCAMNMINEDAFLPDSILKAYNGKTVEIGHTDAEGRLVLADAMAYTVEQYKPKEMINLATLTGAILAALAGRYAGVFSTSDRVANGLNRAGEETGDNVWRMPVTDEFLAKSKVADMNNDGSPYGGSAVAAAFLKQFVGNTPWAHIDIAGVAWSGKGEGPNVYPTLPWATGFGVRLLTHYLESQAK